MNNKYFELLLPDTKKLLLLIENHIGQEVFVREVSMRNNHGCEIHNATILVPEGKFQDSSVLHELLHIRRFRVDGVPELFVCDSFDCGDHNFFNSVCRMDGNIEHLFIVPVEISLRPDRLTYWEDRMIEALKAFEKSELDANHSECDAILNWLFAQIIFGNGIVVDKATKVIQKIGCEKIAVNLLSILQHSNCNKEIFSKALIPKLNVPIRSICLKYEDREENLW